MSLKGIVQFKGLTHLKWLIASQGAKLSVFIMSSVIAASVWAFGFMIGEPQVNAMLGLTFPYETRMGENHVTLSDPKPHFYEKSQEVGITLNISLKDLASGEIAKAQTLVKGGIRFDNKAQQLQLVKPKIASLDWLNSSASANKDLVRQVTQLVGQDLPVIVLLDIKQLTGSAFTPALSDIKVKSSGIEIIF